MCGSPHPEPLLIVRNRYFLIPHGLGAAASVTFIVRNPSATSPAGVPFRVGLLPFATIPEGIVIVSPPQTAERRSAAIEQFCVAFSRDHSTLSPTSRGPMTSLTFWVGKAA